MTGAATDLPGVCGSAASDVWAVGSTVGRPVGVALHRDGACWSPLNAPESQELYGAWGTDPGVVWVAGMGGVFQGDGATWTQGARTDWSLSLWGSGPTDVWAVGSGTVLHLGGPGPPALRTAAY